MAVSDLISAVQRLDARARSAAGAGLASERRGEPQAINLAADPAALAAIRNGMVTAPNAELTQEQAAPFGGYSLAFNAPVVHMYSRTTKSIVNLLA